MIAVDAVEAVMPSYIDHTFRLSGFCFGRGGRNITCCSILANSTGWGGAVIVGDVHALRDGEDGVLMKKALFEKK